MECLVSWVFEYNLGFFVVTLAHATEGALTENGINYIPCSHNFEASISHLICVIQATHVV